MLMRQCRVAESGRSSASSTIYLSTVNSCPSDHVFKWSTWSLTHTVTAKAYKGGNWRGIDEELQNALWRDRERLELIVDPLHASPEVLPTIVSIPTSAPILCVDEEKFSSAFMIRQNLTLDHILYISWLGGHLLDSPSSVAAADSSSSSSQLYVSGLFSLSRPQSNKRRLRMCGMSF